MKEEVCYKKTLTFRAINNRWTLSVIALLRPSSGQYVQSSFTCLLTLLLDV